MHHIIKKEEKSNNLKAHFDFLIIEGLPGQLKWEKGILSFKNEYEVLLHHLIWYKSHHCTQKKFWKNVPDTFYIDRYLIRSSGLNSLKKFLNCFYLEKVRPYFYKKFFYAEFLSSKILSLDFKELKECNYILNGMIIWISIDSENRNSVSFNSSEPRRIFKAVYSKKGFFIESIPERKYQLVENNQKLVESHNQGHYHIYDQYLKSTHDRFLLL